MATLDQIQADDSDNIVAGDGATLVGVTGTLMALSFSVVVMRCWARQVILRTFGWDDAAMLLALVGLFPIARARARAPLPPPPPLNGLGARQFPL